MKIEIVSGDRRLSLQKFFIVESVIAVELYHQQAILCFFFCKVSNFKFSIHICVVFFFSCSNSILVYTSFFLSCTFSSLPEITFVFFLLLLLWGFLVLVGFAVEKNDISFIKTAIMRGNIEKKMLAIENVWATCLMYNRLWINITWLCVPAFLPNACILNILFSISVSIFIHSHYCLFACNLYFRCCAFAI